MTKIKRQHLRFSVALLALAGVVVVPFQPTAAVECPISPSDNQLNRTCDPSITTIDPNVISGINTEIAEKQLKLDELKTQEEQLQSQIESKQGEINSFESEVSMISNQIALTDIEIRSKQTQIESLELEVRSLQLSIDQKNADVDAKKSMLADTIRQLDASARTSTLALVMETGSFSDFYSQAQAQAEISSSLQLTIEQIQQAKQELQMKQDELVKIKDENTKSKTQLEVQNEAVNQQREYKAQLLRETQKSAQQYKQLKENVVSDQDYFIESISKLQSELSSVLRGDQLNQANQPSPAGYVWPVSSSPITINACYLDSEYERTMGMIHHGLDIQASQGSAVYAVAAGTIVFKVDPSSPNVLSKVGIQHGGQKLSEYWHLSKIAPKIVVGYEVAQGELIGYSGGKQASPGVGWCGYKWCSTGAHLHFQMSVGADLVNGKKGSTTAPLPFFSPNYILNELLAPDCSRD